MPPLTKLYNTIHLNLGIKKFLNQHVFTEKYVCFLDNKIIFPIFELLEKYFYKRVIYHYGADYHWKDEKSQNINKKKYNFGYGYIHYAFIRNQQPKRILCIGSMYGFIPYMMAKACKENKFGHVDFVDAGFDIKNDKNSHYFGQGFWKKIDTNKHFQYLGVNKFISTYVKTSSQFANKHKSKYDYIYLDGDHSFKGALNNLRLFWPKLTNEGFLCFHDINFDKILNNLLFEHGKMWKKLSKMPYKFELSNHYSGLGFIQKLSNKNPLNYLK